MDLEAAGDAVNYAVTLYTPDAAWRGRAQIVRRDGSIVWGAWAPAEAPVPEWMVKLANAFLRAEWKARQGTDPEPWPARINRWREER